MMQVIPHDLEIKIVIKCYDKSGNGNHYLGCIADYNGMPFGVTVKADTIEQCATEIGKSLEALEAYRKHQKKAS